jgi:hypothetical protein
MITYLADNDVTRAIWPAGLPFEIGLWRVRRHRN